MTHKCHCINQQSADTRKKAIKARLNSYSVDDFKRLFQMAEESDFLKGKNDRNWMANFDWLIKDSNMAKVLDGNYKNKAEKSKGSYEREIDYEALRKQCFAN